MLPSRQTARDKEDEYKENVGSSSVLYNSGGFFVVDVKTGETIYEEYRPGEDDGLGFRKINILSCVFFRMIDFHSTCYFKIIHYGDHVMLWNRLVIDYADYMHILSGYVTRLGTVQRRTEREKKNEKKRK